MNRDYNPKYDPAFQRPVIEIDEWREQFLPDGTRLPYRYMCGTFSGTKVQFSLLFPERESYLKRFHQCLTPDLKQEPGTVGTEAALALKNGAYYVESAGTGEMPWRACAAVAEFARKKAREIYGPVRSYGYVYGEEGSASKTLACIENASAWDGAALVMSETQTILYDAADGSHFVLTEEVRGLPHALSALENWVERGVCPA